MDSCCHMVIPPLSFQSWISPTSDQGGNLHRPTFPHIFCWGKKTPHAKLVSNQLRTPLPESPSSSLPILTISPKWRRCTLLPAPASQNMGCWLVKSFKPTHCSAAFWRTKYKTIAITYDKGKWISVHNIRVQKYVAIYTILLQFYTFSEWFKII